MQTADVNATLTSVYGVKGLLKVALAGGRSGAADRVLYLIAGGQESHMRRAMAYASALAVLTLGGGVRAGGSCEVMLPDPDLPGPDGAPACRRPPCAAPIASGRLSLARGISYCFNDNHS